MEKSRYRPEIDGLRALAVVAVVLFHAGWGFPGGYIGVDVFFVISGFLITGIILRGLEQSTFSLVEFWERRVRRIFPALFATVAGTLALGYMLLLPQELEELGESSIAQAMLLANVYFWRDTGYFAGPAELKPLLHTWSLAVEEQFYLFFPPLLMLFRRYKRHSLFGGLLLLSVISLAGSIYGAMYHKSATFYLLPTRAWELLVGCLLAASPWTLKSRPIRDDAIAVIGMLAIIVPMFQYTSETSFPGLAAMPPVLGTTAVIFATGTTRNTWVGTLLSFRPIVFVGLISYSLYLWHWPIIVFVRTYFGRFGWQEVTLALVCSSVLSILSWKYVETPCRQRTFLPRRSRLFGTALLLSTATIGISIFFVVAEGLPSRIPNYSTVLLEDTTWNGDEKAISLEGDIRFETLPTLGVEYDADNSQRLDFVLWGDSHARTLSNLIDDIALDLDLTGKAIATSNVPAIPNVCMPFNEFVPPRQMLARQAAVMKILSDARPRNLLLVSRWTWYTNGNSKLESAGPGKSHLLTDDAKKLSITDPQQNVITRNLKFLVEFCEGNDIQIWFVQQVPETGESSPARNLFLHSVGRASKLSDKRTSHSQYQKRRAAVDDILQNEALQALRFIDLAPPLFGKDNRTINYLEGRSLYRDDDHLTKWGLEKVRPVVEAAMLSMKASVNRNIESSDQQHDD